MLEEMSCKTVAGATATVYGGKGSSWSGKIVLPGRAAALLAEQVVLRYVPPAGPQAHPTAHHLPAYSIGCHLPSCPPAHCSALPHYCTVLPTPLSPSPFSAAGPHLPYILYLNLSSLGQLAATTLPYPTQLPSSLSLHPPHLKWTFLLKPMRELREASPST